uniref:Ovule protein n=1 Tax=Panagrolaimus sp. ES5 TaxID=591445 RepID=A0AC34GN32_9BILA
MQEFNENELHCKTSKKTLHFLFIKNQKILSLISFFVFLHIKFLLSLVLCGCCQVKIWGVLYCLFIVLFRSG